MIARNMTNLTPAQLEEFEQTFRYFDADNTNTLNLYEFCGALSSLGFMYDDEKAELKFYEITKNAEFATFEQFIRFMVQVTEDKTTPDQLLESFKTMAQDKPFITELDLTMCHMPQKLITSLKMAMPQSSENENGYDYGSFVKDMFIQKPRK
jgi:hypothetical protein